ncbi:hypothetical protein [Nocardioides speluncae]|uniref:hypothetical protein n=1 Tax=Nocardioides speluncae TaxID=2670337 RepID=UPI000D696BEE|nr:hypothetical protein [Nocardioides speluncae]
MKFLRTLAVVLAAVLAIGLAIGLAQPVSAGPPGTWSRVSATTAISYGDHATYRTADGVVHLVYRKPGSSSGSAYGHTAISPSGRVIRQNTLLNNWHTLTVAPQLVPAPGGGIRLIFQGRRVTDDAEPYGDLATYTAIAPASGASWVLQTDQIGGGDVPTGDLAATTLSSGTPVVAWSNFTIGGPDDGGWIKWRSGFGPGGINHIHREVQAQNAELVRDGSKVWLSWYEDGGTATTRGYFVKQLLPSAGPVKRAPGSNEHISASPLAARANGGAYLAYCYGQRDPVTGCKRIALWRIGTATPRTLAAYNVGDLALSRGPSGRLWLSWHSSDNLVAVRTNKAATAFGPARTIKTNGVPCCWTGHAANGSRSLLDGFVSTFSGVYHQQVKPGLRLSATPGRWNGDRSRVVTFRVNDAGDAVSGALIKVGDRRCTTNSTGRCTIRFPQMNPRRMTAKATKSGYHPATRPLRVT